MVNKYLFAVPVILLFAALSSLWLCPTITPILGMVSLLFSLALSTNTIIQKHVETEPARAKILKDVGVMVLTLVIILFLGGIASMLANAQVSVRWGEVAGLISAIAASFGVGYLVRVGVGRLVG